jgi:membrane-bound lytic murein transglycosylase F
MRKHSAYRITPDGDLSPYDDIVKPLAKANNMDWRLIISQMYQESRFNTHAKSFAGAQGLMQVLPRTAKEMGYSNLSEPANGIGAGIAYMDWLRDRFPGEMDFQERLYFTLAAYNAGTGHVRDARRLAKKLGKDPNRWFGHTEVAMLKLSQPEYFRQARFGYVRGSEPVEYVRRIRDRYLAYLATGKS